MYKRHMGTFLSPNTGGCTLSVTNPSCGGIAIKCPYKHNPWWPPFFCLLSHCRYFSHHSSCGLRGSDCGSPCLCSWSNHFCGGCKTQLKYWKWKCLHGRKIFCRLAMRFVRFVFLPRSNKISTLDHSHYCHACLNVQWVCSYFSPCTENISGPLECQL